MKPRAALAALLLLASLPSGLSAYEPAPPPPLEFIPLGPRLARPDAEPTTSAPPRVRRVEASGGARTRTRPGPAALTGWASWYRVPGMVGAAGPELRVGAWRGRVVHVCTAGRCVAVRLVDWCACPARHGHPTLVDLSPTAFRALGAALTAGIIRIEVQP